MPDRDRQTTGGPDHVSSAERMNRANLWEASADERERLADERERVADERESLANERERLADEHDRALDRRSHRSSKDDVDEATELAEVQAALNRAEARCPTRRGRVAASAPDRRTSACAGNAPRCCK